MDILISNSDTRPIYEQITHQIKNQIINGALKEGDALPSMRVLAKELRISVITTKRAYEDLERDGFLITRAGKGSFVATRNVSAIQEEHLRQVKNHLSKAVQLALLSSISQEQLSDLLNRLYKGESI
ncbi:MAG: GntR family transcriptional regulator [Clostridium sp.]|uniref:GntR family transcriptional regulator n=1 Tax=Clostridium sp. TaxID=1506 RepID=UPI00290C6105|nr:GntR family transcriptional regulator [Clostridium sp.]MDU7338432.1 GntR family transcriptional regulator [Clostridium sp.]